MGEDTDRRIIRDVPMDEIVLYRVRDDELRELERGSPASTVFAICLASAGVGAGGLLGLMGSPVPAPGQITGRWVISLGITLVTIAAALILLLVWWRLPNQTKEIIARIRARDKMPTGTPASNSGTVKPEGT